MALGKITSQPHLLDTLLELNDLIKALGNGDIKKAVDDIKNHKTALDKTLADHARSKAAHEESAAKLSAVTDENEKFIIAARKERESLAALKHDLDMQAKKLEAEKKSLENAKKDHDAHVKAVNGDLNSKAASVAGKEAAAQELHKLALSIKSEYESKIASLKKLAG